MDNFLLQFFIFLAAAAIAVPIAKKLGLGSVLGYLIAGIVIGPFGLALISDVEAVMHFTEFGVVMMLFIVGLELKPTLLWQMRVPILGTGGLQVVLTTLAITGLSLFFLPWRQALALGLILSLSSTAIVLQTLREKGLMETTVGRQVFSVLLFQDLAVIPMMAIIPLLGQGAEHHGTSHGESHLFDISSLPGSIQLLLTIGALLAIFFIAKFVSRPLFRTIAATGVREIFIAAALALVVGISLLMTAVGLSPALGTFLAGVVLADSEYRHELESDIEPFKGLLLGIFFISIGASLNFILIGHKLILIASLTAALLLTKALILFITGKLFKMPNREVSLFSIALAQGGEFAFVLFQFARSEKVLPPETIEILISAVAISMFLAPLLFLLREKLAGDRLKGKKCARAEDSINSHGQKVILAGFGRLGTDLGRFLISAGIQPVILDNDPANVDLLKKFGFEVYYGDVTRLDLLEAAGAGEAKLLIIAIGKSDIGKKLVELVQKHYPNLKILINASDRSAAYSFMDMGETNIRRETFGTALELGQDSLELLGFAPYEAYRKMRLFRKEDENKLPELYRIHREDEESYVSVYKKHLTDLEELIRMDEQGDWEEQDKAWTAKNPEN
ncbi:MAG: monovalent cation:proton antiporter-2 (CPA2) family protein [Spirochaetales bacterium]|nr:monovalent cation:proton antiporter-2 (CPA2) family protein [Spirochaetales bacterium]